MTVVVAYSADALGRVALEHGVAQARERDEDVLVLNVTRGDAYVDKQFATPETIEHLGAELEQQGVRGEVRQEIATDVAGGLVEAARSASLLVVGVRPRSPVGKMLLGSVTQKVLLDADVPVLAVSTPPSAADDAPVAVAFRDDEFGQAALGFAARESQRSGRRLLVVHVDQSDTRGGTVPEDELAETCERLREQGIEAEDVRLQDPDAAGAVQRLVAERGAGLLVIGIRKRTPVGKMFMGSVAQRLILDLEVPVAAVKPR